MSTVTNKAPTTRRREQPENSATARKTQRRKPQTTQSRKPSSASATAKKRFRPATRPQPTRRKKQSLRQETLPKSSQVTTIAEQPVPAYEEGFRFTIAHAFILLSYLVGATLTLIFGLDLATQIPFDRGSISYDIANIVGGLTLIYLSYSCHRDLK